MKQPSIIKNFSPICSFTVIEWGAQMEQSKLATKGVSGTRDHEIPAGDSRYRRGRHQAPLASWNATLSGNR